MRITLGCLKKLIGEVTHPAIEREKAQASTSSTPPRDDRPGIATGSVAATKASSAKQKPAQSGYRVKSGSKKGLAIGHDGPMTKVKWDDGTVSLEQGTALEDLQEVIAEIVHEERDVVLYHTSPELGLRKIMPRYSPKFGERGVFVTTSIEAILNSWASWALRKQIGRSGKRSSDELFDSVAVYTIRMPRKLFDEAERRHEAAADAAYRDDGSSFGAWGWDVETFIPEDLAQSLTPTSVKVYTRQQLEGELDDRHRRGWKHAGHAGGKSRREALRIPAGGKNPARDVLRTLEDEYETLALRYKGQGSFVQKQVFDASLQKNFARLRELSKKTRLSPAERSETSKIAANVRASFDDKLRDVSSDEQQAQTGDTRHGRR